MGEGAKVDKPNLYLVGFMGTGKTTLGRRLARELGFRFLDSDHEIEKRAGMKVAQIFEQMGEGAFRKMEREFIESGHPNSNCVVACGGGLVCRDDMPSLVRSKGVSVVLFSTAEEILQRVSGNKNRPLLNVPNPLERIRALMQERESFYLKAGIAILVDKALDATQARILRVYNSEVTLRAKSGNPR